MPDLDSLNSYLSRFLNQETLGMLLFWCLIALATAKKARRRVNLTSGQYFWVATSIIGILGFTLRFFNLEGSNPIPWLFNFADWANAFLLGTNWYLNVLLFVPLSFVLVIFGKKPAHVFLGLVLLSATIESIQQITWSGVADPADFVANSTGSLLGLTLGLLGKKLFSK